MFTRAVTFTDATNLDAGTEYVRDTANAVLHQQKGFAGTIASVDRANNVFGVLTRWETEADRDASESALLKVREEGQEIIGGALTVEYYEEVLLELITPPQVGNSLIVSRAAMDPATIDQNIAYFKREILPQIKQDPGVLFIRQLVNRQTGEAIVGTGWADVASMRAAVVKAEARAANAPVTITGRSEREIVFLDQP
jgi:hypothetical protein